MRFWRSKEKVHVVLARFPVTTSAAVAAFLVKEGAQAKKDQPRSEVCPVAVYLRRETRRDIEIGGAAVYGDTEDRLPVDLPPAIRAFISEYDRGFWPLLAPRRPKGMR